MHRRYPVTNPTALIPTTKSPARIAPVGRLAHRAGFLALLSFSGQSFDKDRLWVSADPSEEQQCSGGRENVPE